MSDKKKKPNPLEEQITELQEQLGQAQDQAQRALADYQNLVRRTQEERAKLIKLASKDFVESLLQPLEHLRLAAEQLNDTGLNMVITQLWHTLESQGVQKIEPKPGDTFDLTTMEAIENKGDGEEVTAVQSCGYRLNGEVIRFAKVTVGSLEK